MWQPLQRHASRALNFLIVAPPGEGKTTLLRALLFELQYALRRVVAWGSPELQSLCCTQQSQRRQSVGEFLRLVLAPRPGLRIDANSDVVLENVPHYAQRELLSLWRYNHLYNCSCLVTVQISDLHANGAVAHVLCRAADVVFVRASTRKECRKLYRHFFAEHSAWQQFEPFERRMAGLAPFEFLVRDRACGTADNTLVASPSSAFRLHADCMQPLCCCVMQALTQALDAALPVPQLASLVITFLHDRSWHLEG